MDIKKKSKTISYVLRHHPEEFDLCPDKDGFVDIDELLTAIEEKNHMTITRQDLDYIIKNSEKKRFEISGERIRATYGHSKVVVEKEPIRPPDVLYHGTSHRAYEEIKKYGLLPMKRQYVHLSSDTDTAVKVGKRRDKNPVIITVDAKLAFEDGIRFFYGNDSTYLSEKIPFKYLSTGKIDF